MKYQQKRFTVPASSSVRPKDCAHGWVDPRGKCCLCGELVQPPEAPDP